MKTRLLMIWIRKKVRPAYPLVYPARVTLLSTEPSDDEGEEEDEDEPQQPTTGDRNSQLMVGYKGDRSYVVRGNNIGVFNHSNDHSVKYYATISNVATPKGKSFKPTNVFVSKLTRDVILTGLLGHAARSRH